MRFPLDLPPGLIGDETSYSAENRWWRASNVRFWRGRPQVIGGWESLTTELLTGVCRTVFPWSGEDNQISMVFGTHSNLQVWVGGELADISPVGLDPGQIDGTGGTGYGTGAYGVGGYGEPSIIEYFPRTWSMGAWGKQLACSPRDGTIYLWNNNLATKATAVTNAPANVTFSLVGPKDQVFALGCNEEVSGDFNSLCIRHSSIRIIDEWDTSFSTTAREYILPGGGRIVAGRVMGDRILVWTDSALYMGTFVGALDQPWRFDPVALSCGLIGPNAVVVLGQTAYWLGVDKQFRAYVLGGAPVTIPCPVRSNIDTFLAASQGDKIVASSCAQYGEIRFDYPDSRDGYENSRYLTLATVGDDVGAWSTGEMARTAYVEAGPSQFPCGVTYEGNCYWHERGNSADGSPFAWYLESGDLYLSPDRTMMVRGVWPDFEDQAGPINLTLYGRFKPQADEVTYGPYALSPMADRSDFRASGRMLRTLFEGNASPTGGRFGKPVFDLQKTGMR